MLFKKSKDPCNTIEIYTLATAVLCLSAAMGPSPAVVYITEVARADLRGALICTGPSMTSLGESHSQQSTDYL